MSSHIRVRPGRFTTRAVATATHSIADQVVWSGKSNYWWDPSAGRPARSKSDQRNSLIRTCDDAGPGSDLLGYGCNTACKCRTTAAAMSQDSSLAVHDAISFGSYRRFGETCCLQLNCPKTFQEELLLGCSWTDYTLTLWNCSTYIPIDTASYTRRLESSSKPPREPQISQETNVDRPPYFLYNGYRQHFHHSYSGRDVSREAYLHSSSRPVNCTEQTLPRCHGTHPRHTATPTVPIFCRRARWPHGTAVIDSAMRRPLPIHRRYFAGCTENKVLYFTQP
jgi:hypothetical protein